MNEKDLLPIVYRKLQEHKAICAKHNLFFVVTSVYRSIEAQDALYAQGRTKPGAIVTNAKGGQSYHNHRVAYDICPIVNGKAQWNDDSLFAAIAFFGEQIGLEAGYNWKGFKDGPHYQYTLGYTFKDFINKKIDLNKFK